MKVLAMPTREELVRHAEAVPEIRPEEVLAMLTIMQAASGIKEKILDVLQKEYQLSEGKLCVLILLHQTEEGLAPSEIARRAGVTKATVSVMLQRMEREHLVEIRADDGDGRAKRVFLTKLGRTFMDKVLPEHYVRITRLMGKLSRQEQEELIRLLKKLSV